MAFSTSKGLLNSPLSASSKRTYEESYAIANETPSKRSKLSPPPLTPPASQPSTPTDIDSAPTTPTRSSHEIRPKIYVCTKFPPCAQRFDRPCRLAEHERSHTGARPFVCTVSPETCNKTFSRDYHLSRHIRHAHSPDEATSRPFVCSFELDLGSVTGSQLGDVEEGAEICGKSFATRQRLTLHERTHRNKPRCTEMVHDGNGGFRRCAAVFRKEITLKAHIDKIHRGVKPFICGKEMNRIAGEEGEKKICEAGYDTQGKLNEHIRRCHSGPKYVCGVCVAQPSSETATEESMSIDGDGTGLLAFETLAELAVHNRLVHPAPKEPRCPRGRPSGSKSPNDETRLQKPKKRANQHTERLEFMASVPAADLLTGSINPSNQLVPMIDAMDITSNASVIDTEGWLKCPADHCEDLFPTETLLVEHCSIVHKMAQVEVTEALKEQEALKGGVFWLGGWREEDDLDNQWNWTMNSTNMMIDPNLEDVDMTG